jgi:Domain of unknown function (DUF4910)
MSFSIRANTTATGSEFSRLVLGFADFSQSIAPLRGRGPSKIGGQTVQTKLGLANLAQANGTRKIPKRIASLQTRYSYRFLFAPGTIGAITWLARNEDKLEHFKHGLVISMVGDGGGPTCKKSRRGNAKIDQAVTPRSSSP